MCSKTTGSANCVGAHHQNNLPMIWMLNLQICSSWFSSQTVKSNIKDEDKLRWYLHVHHLRRILNVKWAYVDILPASEKLFGWYSFCIAELLLGFVSHSTRAHAYRLASPCWFRDYNFIFTLSSFWLLKIPVCSFTTRITVNTENYTEYVTPWNENGNNPDLPGRTSERIITNDLKIIKEIWLLFTSWRLLTVGGRCFLIKHLHIAYRWMTDSTNEEIRRQL